MSEVSSNLFGLVLAGGKSRRMGRDKALVEYAGQTQLGRAVNLLSRHCSKVFVSARADQAADAERGRYALIIDRYDNLGPVAGILSAAEQEPQAAWLVLACDLPNVDDETLSYLITNRDSDKPATAFRSSHDGLPEPLCAIFAPGCAEWISQFVSAGISCPRKMLLKSDVRLLDQPHANALDNLNTPDDLANWTARHAASSEL